MANGCPAANCNRDADVELAFEQIVVICNTLGEWEDVAPCRPEVQQVYDLRYDREQLWNVLYDVRLVLKRDRNNEHLARRVQDALDGIYPSREAKDGDEVSSADNTGDANGQAPHDTQRPVEAA